jgi:hypothetical protein
MPTIGVVRPAKEKNMNYPSLPRNLTHLFALATAALALGIAAPDTSRVAAAADDVEPLDIVAASVRDRGYSCEDPKEAKRDEAASKPDEAAWLIDCGNARYRVIYQGDTGVEVEAVD